MPQRDADTGWIWDICCRVIDNHGDLGVCWRLCRQLASRGHLCRLWVDDASALAWMAPVGAAGVEVLDWENATVPSRPADVLVEAFGCDPPERLLKAMAQQARPPVWVNLEYLSAEAYVERSHGLRSPQFSGPGAGLDKWFYYPGFTSATGGLLRDAAAAATDPVATLTASDALRQLTGIDTRSDATVVSVFCYESARLRALEPLLPQGPVQVLCAPGQAAAAVARWRAGMSAALAKRLSFHPLPWLPQPDYDRLLAACDLNVVRGEDSFAQSHWAGRPQLWNIYAQDDGVHAGKLQAYLDRALHTADAALAAGLRHAHAVLNGLISPDTGPAVLDGPNLPQLWPAWNAQARSWRAELQAQPDLVTQLLAFVAEKRGQG